MNKYLIKITKHIEYFYDKISVSIASFLLTKRFYIQNKPDLLSEWYSDAENDCKFYNKKADYVTKDLNRLIMLKSILNHVNNLEEGHYGELGTYRGLFARYIYKYMNKKYNLYCFDTFEGFNKKDIDVEQKITGKKYNENFFKDTSLEKVKNTIINTIEEGDNLFLIKGYFPDSFVNYEDIKWRFVHLDADLYEPIFNGLVKFWPNVVKNGCVLIHDYNNHYRGVKKAVEDYFKNKELILIALPDKSGSVLLIKT